MESNLMITEAGKVEAYPVLKHARMGTPPRHLGEHMLTVEDWTLDLMRDYCPD